MEVLTEQGLDIQVAKSGALKLPDTLPASRLATEYQVSVRVAHAAFVMLVGKSYVI
jgi:hypothetical protein